MGVVSWPAEVPMDDEVVALLLKVVDVSAAHAALVLLRDEPEASTDRIVMAGVEGAVRCLLRHALVEPVTQPQLLAALAAGVRVT